MEEFKVHMKLFHNDDDDGDQLSKTFWVLVFQQYTNFQTYSYMKIMDIYRKILTISRTIFTWIWWPEVGMRLIYKTNSTTNISSP